MTASVIPAELSARQLPLTLDRRSPIPLYHQLAEQLVQAVEQGVLRPGDAFENETSLAERLGLSRPTVRRSIAALVDRGLLVRKRGVGTVVAHEVVHRRNELSSLYDDLAESGQQPSTRLLVLDRAAIDHRAAEALGLDPCTPLVRIERLRLANGQPVAILKNWLPPRLANLSVSQLESRGLYDLLRDRGECPVVAHQSLGSRRSLIDERRLLEMPPQEPVLTMARQSYDASGAVIEYGDHCYRADRHRFDVTVHAS